MKKITLLILFMFFTFTNLVSSQVVSGMFNVSVNNSPIENCSTISLVNNESVTVSFTLRITKPSSTDVGSTAKFKIFMKKNSSATPIELNGILVNNAAFSGGTEWQGTFSQVITAASIEVTGSKFYGEYTNASSSTPAKTCTYALTKNPSPTFEINPTSQSISCDPQRSYTFTVNNVYNSPGSLIYKWYLPEGWSRNGVPIPAYTTITTNENYIDLKPTDYTIVPLFVEVTPVFNGENKASKRCYTTRSGFSPSLLTISGNPSICYQSASETYSIPNLYNGLTVSWSSDNNSIATVTNSGNQATVVPVSKGNFTLTGVVANACGQTYAIKKDVAIISYPVANFTGEKVQQYIYEYRGQDLYNDFSTYTWEKISSTDYVDFNNMGNRVIITAFPPFSVTMKLTATNACGSDVIYTTLSLNTEDEEINRVANPNNPDLTANNTLDKSNLLKISEVYPNPSNNIVNIKIKGTNSSIQKSGITAKLYDLNGNKKNEIKIENEITPLNVQGLPKGIYILKINNNGKEEINKIIIN